jgi:hypothetical protein
MHRASAVVQTAVAKVAAATRAANVFAITRLLSVGSISYRSRAVVFKPLHDKALQVKDSRDSNGKLNCEGMASLGRM